jgi:alpha-tubulin suppressor-like RCC1 family protein
VQVTKVRSVACGHSHLAVVSASHELLTLGENQYGQLGLGDTEARSTPQIVGCSQVFQVDAGHSHTVFATLNGTLFSFGSNTSGQAGQPRQRRILTEPELVQNISGATCYVACGDFHTLVISDSPTTPLMAFGNNEFGTLSFAAPSVPHPPPTVPHVPLPLSLYLLLPGRGTPVL